MAQKGIKASDGATAGDFLFDLGHANSLLGDVVGEEDMVIGGEAPDIVGKRSRRLRALLCWVCPRLPEGGVRGLAAAPSVRMAS